MLPLVYTVFNKHHENMAKILLTSIRMHYKGPLAAIVNYDRDETMTKYMDALQCACAKLDKPANVPNEPGWDIVRLKPDIDKFVDLSNITNILYMDADCIVCDSLDPLLEQKHTMIMNEQKAGYMLRGINFSEWGIPDDVVKPVDINSGIVLFCKEDFSLLDDWRKITDFALETPERTATAMSKCYDQFTLQVAMARKGYISPDSPVKKLHALYNYSIQLAGPPEQYDIEKVYIIHLSGSDKKSPTFAVYDALKQSKLLYEEYTKVKTVLEATWAKL